MTNSTSGDAVKRIKLEVTTGQVNLRPINQAVDALGRLNTVLRRVNSGAAILQRQSGINLAGIGRGASRAAAEMTRSVDVIERQSRRAQRAVSGVGGGGRDPRWLQRGIDSWTPRGFARNTMTVGGWSAAAGSFYLLTRGISHSLGRMKDLELQTARLSQVFRGTGGNASQLMDDVLKLASAEGRGSEEAAQSAVAWSRLGLTRQQVTEATKVSLMAANVAELDSAEATQRLTSVMAGYGLQVNQLAPSLSILNDLSNKYRVTNKDLLDGLSRVSGVARGAGMGLAELSGLLTTSVQKTGQTGANMSNALKTIFSRMNRDDVRGFFSTRFNTDIEGTAQGLQKVWEIYSKSNEEQQRDITLKVGAATQANRFRAIMDSYSSGILAGVDALKNLNSAQEENLKVTNTINAATARLGATWDRFVNSAGEGGANGYLKNWLNAGSGAIAGMTSSPTGRGRTPLYYDPSQANGWGTAAVVGNAMSLGIGGQLGRQIFGDSYSRNYWGNLGYSQNPQNSGDIFAMASGNINARRSSGESSALLARHLESIQKNWSGFTPDSKGNILKSIEGRLTPSTLSALSGGDTSGLAAEIARLKASSKRDFAGAATLAGRDIERLRSEQAITIDVSKRAELEAQINERLGTQVLASASVADNEERGATKLQVMTAELTNHRGLMKDINSYFSSSGLSQYASEIATLNASITATKTAMETSTSEDALQGMRSELQAFEARLAYLKSGAGQAFAASTQSEQINRQIFSSQVDAAGVGGNETERLVSQRNFLGGQLAGFSRSGINSEQDRVKVLESVNRLKEIELRLTQRGYEIEKERNQEMREGRKRFAESLVDASPSQLLRKMAVNQSLRKGMSPGKFWGMDSESRRDAFDLMGGNRGRELQGEATLNRGQALNVPQLQLATSGLESFGSRIAEQAGAISAATSSVNTFASAVETAAARITAAASNMNTSAPAQASAPSVSSPPQA